VLSGQRSATDTHRFPTEWTSPSGRRWRQRPGGTSTVDCVVVVLSESASLTARETLTVLGMRGMRADVLATHALTIGRFSRWRRRSIPAPPPSRDPLGYLAVVRRLMTSGEYEAVSATHEQAWLFAAGRLLLPQDAPIAVASIQGCGRAQVAHGMTACVTGEGQSEGAPTRSEEPLAFGQRQCASPTYSRRHQRRQSAVSLADVSSHNWVWTASGKARGRPWTLVWTVPSLVDTKQASEFP
jgi:hypothetical protein